MALLTSMNPLTISDLGVVLATNTLKRLEEWRLLGGFGIEPSHTQKIENGRAKDAGSKNPEVADPISILQASRFGQAPFVDTEATNTNPT
jgi:hypothetical protein